MQPKILSLFSDMVARQIYPAMAQLGLQRKGKRLWWERHDDGSVVALEILVSRFTTRTELGFTFNIGVWPPGLWHRSEHDHPDSANAPIMRRPERVAPELWPWQDFREIDLAADFGEVGQQLLASLTAALAWARANSDVDSALSAVGTSTGNLNDFGAIKMLRAVAPAHPRLPEFIESYTQRWRKDPQPIIERDEIQRWRAEAGLPPAQDLPWYWHEAMRPIWVEQYGWPGAAFKIGLDSEFHLADGTKTRVPPADWPRH